MSIARLIQQAAAGVSAGVDPNVWTLNNVTSLASPRNDLYVGFQESNPRSPRFKPDGTKMYIVGNGDDAINEYNLSTAWDLGSATYTRTSIAVPDGQTNGVFFKPDGTKVYFIGNITDKIYEYDISPAWDISNISLVGSISITTYDDIPTGIFFKPDGTKMYFTGNRNDSIYEFDLSTAWDISTASHLQTLSVTAKEGVPNDVFFKSDGLTMYIIGQSSDQVHQYTLSTAWDISTASFLQSFVTSTSGPSGLWFKPDGTYLYFVDSLSKKVLGYSLPTAWDISTAVFVPPTTDYFSVRTQEATPQALFIKPDGTKMYVVGTTTDTVYEYNIGTAWDISTASYLQSFSISSRESTPNGLTFKPDGTKMYNIGSSGDDVNEFDLSTAWDITSASYLQSFSVATQEPTPSDLFFKPDGTKMYACGTVGNAVVEYDLSTAWDISTSVYLQSFSVLTQESNINGIFFDPDGIKMFIIGTTGDDINEYTLGTAWDITSATYVQTYSVIEEDDVPTGLFFKPDGTKIYIMGQTTDAVWAYSLT